MHNASRPKILYLTHRVPYPPDKGDRIRNYHILAWLARRASVDLACLADEDVDDAVGGDAGDAGRSRRGRATVAGARWATGCLVIRDGSHGHRGCVSFSEVMQRDSSAGSATAAITSRWHPHRAWFPTCDSKNSKVYRRSWTWWMSTARNGWTTPGPAVARVPGSIGSKGDGSGAWNTTRPLGLAAHSWSAKPKRTCSDRHATLPMFTPCPMAWT